MTRTAFPQKAAQATANPTQSSLPCWLIYQFFPTALLTARTLTASRQSSPSFSVIVVLQTECPFSSMTNSYTNYPSIHKYL